MLYFAISIYERIIVGKTRIIILYRDCCLEGLAGAPLGRNITVVVLRIVDLEAVLLDIPS
jgi:hypothetical protein